MALVRRSWDYSECDVVRTAGLEPAQPFSRGILSPLRLPFRHVREHDISPRHISLLLPCVNEQEEDDNEADSWRNPGGAPRSFGGMDVAGPAYETA